MYAILKYHLYAIHNVSKGRGKEENAPGRFVRLSHGNTHYEIHNNNVSSRATLSGSKPNDNSRPLVVVCHGLCGAAETWRTDSETAEVFEWTAHSDEGQWHR